MSNRQLDWTEIRSRIRTLFDEVSENLTATCAAIDAQPSTMSRFFAKGSTKELNAGTLLAIAQHFDKTVDWLMFGEDAANGVRALPPGVGAGLQMVDHALIDFWPGNPRKHFDEGKLAELAERMLAYSDNPAKCGMLQNLTVRPHPEKDGRYQLAAGERRLRAVRINVEGGSIDANVLVPASVQDVTDATMLQMALTENVDRQDMTPIEEARGYAHLQKLRSTEAGEEISAGKLAEEIGVNKRTLQKRLKLLSDLDPAVQDALDSGAIGVEFANVLTTTTMDVQREALPQLTGTDRIPRQIGTTDGLKNYLFGDKPHIDRAIFPLDLYTDAGGIRVGDSKQYFDNYPLFLRLQREAVTEKAAELGKVWPTVKIYDATEGQRFNSWDFTKSKNKKKAWAVIEIGYRGQVLITEGTVPRPETREGKKQVVADAGPVEKTAIESLTNGHLEHASRRRTETIQRAMMHDPISATRCVVMALLNGASDHTIAISCDQIATNDKVIADPVADKIDAWLKRLKLDNVNCFDSNRSAAAWQILCEADESDVMGLFAALVARQTGTRSGYSPTPGDDPLPLAIATTLGVTGNEAQYGLSDGQAGDMDGLRRPALSAVATSLGATITDKHKNKGIVAVIEARTGRADQTDTDAIEGYVLPTLRFGSAADIAAAFKETAVNEPVKEPDIQRRKGLSKPERIVAECAWLAFQFEVTPSTMFEPVADQGDDLAYSDFWAAIEAASDLATPVMDSVREQYNTFWKVAEFVHEALKAQG